MDKNSSLFHSLVTQLHLTRGDSDIYYGRYRGFPFAVQPLVTPDTFGLLFHVRHPFDQQSLPHMEQSYGQELDEMIINEAAQISVESRIAWFELYDASELLQSGNLMRLLDSVLNCFERVGLGTDDLCHDCRKEPVKSVSYHKGRVAQICPACMDLRVRGAYQSVAGDSKKRAVLIGVCLMAIIIASVAWTALWIGYDYMIHFLASKGRGG